jgi:hypothetical protein
MYQGDQGGNRLNSFQLGENAPRMDRGHRGASKFRFVQRIVVQDSGVVQKLPILGNTDEQIPAAHEGGV